MWVSEEKGTSVAVVMRSRRMTRRGWIVLGSGVVGVGWGGGPVVR
jgi:hypothetical protein